MAGVVAELDDERLWAIFEKYAIRVYIGTHSPSRPDPRMAAPIKEFKILTEADFMLALESACACKVIGKVLNDPGAPAQLRAVALSGCLGYFGGFIEMCPDCLANMLRETAGVFSRGLCCGTRHSRSAAQMTAYASIVTALDECKTHADLLAREDKLATPVDTNISTDICERGAYTAAQAAIMWTDYFSERVTAIEAAERLSLSPAHLPASASADASTATTATVAAPGPGVDKVEADQMQNAARRHAAFRAETRRLRKEREEVQ